MYTPRGRGRAARPPRSTSRLASAATSPACRGAEPLAQRRGRDPERAQLLDQPFDPRRVGLGVDAVDRRHPARARATAATCSLVRIISRSISRCDSVCATAAGPGHVASASKRNSGSADSTSRLVPPRCSPSAAATSRAAASGSATSSGGRAAAGEDQVELVVVEAGVGADAAAVEARRARPRRRRRARSRRSPPAARLPGARLQASSLSARGSIGSTVPGHVGAVGAPARLEVERRARPDVGGDVGDVDPDAGPVALALGGDRIVEVARGRRVDGEGRRARSGRGAAPRLARPPRPPVRLDLERGREAAATELARRSIASTASRSRSSASRSRRRERPARPRRGGSTTEPWLGGEDLEGRVRRASSALVAGSSRTRMSGWIPWPRQVDAVGGEVLADGQLQRAAVGEARPPAGRRPCRRSACRPPRRRPSSASAAVRISAAEAVLRSIRTTIGSARQVAADASCRRLSPWVRDLVVTTTSPRAGRCWRSAPPPRAGRRGCRAGRAAIPSAPSSCDLFDRPPQRRVRPLR